VVARLTALAVLGLLVSLPTAGLADVFVAELGSGEVSSVDRATDVVTAIVTGLQEPVDVAVLPSMDLLVAERVDGDPATGRLTVFDHTDGWSAQPPDEPGFQPNAVHVAADGTIYAATQAHGVQVRGPADPGWSQLSDLAGPVVGLTGFEGFLYAVAGEAVHRVDPAASEPAGNHDLVVDVPGLTVCTAVGSRLLCGTDGDELVLLAEIGPGGGGFVLGTFGPVVQPGGLAVDDWGTVHVTHREASGGLSSVHPDAVSAIATWASFADLDQPAGIAWDPSCDDDDMDGDSTTVCGGDCDDGHPGVHPGAVDVCDGRDGDCDGAIVGQADADFDAWLACGGDCDDADPWTHPGATEVCDDLHDQDCDGADQLADSDGDGWSSVFCGGSDCDDGHPGINPDAADVCQDGVDQDCDGADRPADGDGDGFNAADCDGDDCDDEDPGINPGVAYDCATDVDQDCDGDSNGGDLDGDSYLAAECGGDDCDDGEPEVHPGEPDCPHEAWSGLDTNCDGVVEVADADGDGDASEACAGPDCDDDDPERHTVAMETCNGIADDCDGSIDEDFVRDGENEADCSPWIAPGFTFDCSCQAAPTLAGGPTVLLLVGLLLLLARRPGSRRRGPAVAAVGIALAFGPGLTVGAMAQDEPVPPDPDATAVGAAEEAPDDARDATADREVTDRAALAAFSIHQQWCADAAGDSTTTAANALAAVGPVYAKVSEVLDQVGDPLLLYWRGVLATCMGQGERAIDDLEAFADHANADASYPGLLQDARRRITRARRRLAFAGTGRWDPNPWPTVTIAAGGGLQRGLRGQRRGADVGLRRHEPGGLGPPRPVVSVRRGAAAGDQRPEPGWGQGGGGRARVPPRGRAGGDGTGTRSGPSQPGAARPLRRHGVDEPGGRLPGWPRAPARLRLPIRARLAARAEDLGRRRRAGGPRNGPHPASGQRGAGAGGREASGLTLPWLPGPRDRRVREDRWRRRWSGPPCEVRSDPSALPGRAAVADARAYGVGGDRPAGTGSPLEQPRMAASMTTFAVLLGLLGTAPAEECPVLPPSGPGVACLSAEALGELEDQLIQAGPARCGGVLLEWMHTEVSPPSLQVAGSVAVRWGDPALLPPLYDLFAASVLEPRGSHHDAAYAAASAIDGLTPDDAGVLDPLSTGAHTRRWVQLARSRYVAEWGSAPSEAGREAPEETEQWLADAGARFEACVASPEQAPPDPFDPLGLVVGPASELAVGTRCASVAVLDAWREGSDPHWGLFVDRMVAQYAGQGNFVEISTTLEQLWGQGPSAEAWQPPESPWVGFEPTGVSIRGLLILLAAGLAAVWAILEFWGVVARRARSRLLAVAFGLGSLVALEVLLALVGVPPGDELRPLAPISRLPGGGGSYVPDGRGLPVELPRPADRVRVVVVGASTVVGIKLAWEETVPAQLASALRAEVPCLEVVNQGRMGYASPGIRALAVSAMDDIEADAIVVYTGHNEVTDMRELSRYVDVRPRLLAWQAAVTRTHLFGALAGLLRPGDSADGVEVDRVSVEPLDPRLHNPEFERRVTARFDRELTDIARAARRRRTPLMLVMPSFNHHGLFVDWFEVEAPGDGSQEPAQIATVDTLLEALRAGRGVEAVRLAEALERAAPGHPTPRCLGALARELDGDLDGAEDSVWECARLNHNASSVTPGVASAIGRVAARFELPLADAHAAMHEAAGSHLPGYDLHIDSVHLNPRGARAVAGEIAATMVEAGWVQRWQGVCAGGPR
jgi:lysophospholipase L1-like esterase